MAAGKALGLAAALAAVAAASAAAAFCSRTRYSLMRLRVMSRITRLSTAAQDGSKPDDVPFTSRM